MRFDDPALAGLGRNGRTALRTLDIMDRLTRAAKEPGFDIGRWDELAVLYDTARFRRLAANRPREARGWDEDLRLRHQYALTCGFDYDLRRIAEAGSRVYVDVIEYVIAPVDPFAVNTLAVMEFDEAGLICRSTTFQQWDPGRTPVHVGREDAQTPGGAAAEA